VPVRGLQDQFLVAQVLAVQRPEQGQVVALQGAAGAVEEALDRRVGGRVGRPGHRAPQAPHPRVHQDDRAVGIARCDTVVQAVQRRVQETPLPVDLVPAALLGDQQRAHPRGLVDGLDLIRGPVTRRPVGRTADPDHGARLVAHRLAQVRAGQAVRPDRGAGRHAGVGAGVGEDERRPGPDDDGGEAVGKRGAGDVGPRDRQPEPPVEAQPVTLDEIDQSDGCLCGAGDERGELVGRPADQHASSLEAPAILELWLAQNRTESA
jgi:hypothetical protein